jgi:hypothetical protein
MAYWVHFADGRRACVERPEGDERHVNEFAAELAGSRVVEFWSLPYPAEPRLNRVGTCPSFCFTPERCKGRSACPREHACDD